MSFSQTLRYQIKRPMFLGEQFDDNGNSREVNVLKGQLIEEGKQLGNLVSRDWYGKNTTGIEYKIPTLMNGKNRPSNGMDVFFIPSDNLTQIPDDVYESWTNPTDIDTKTIPSRSANGKYKFNNDTDISVITSYNKNGSPLNGVTYRFKGGDVIDVAKSLFNTETNQWVAIISNITEQEQTIPFSRLSKIDDKTPVTENVAKTEKIYSDNQSGTAGSNTQTSGSNTITQGSGNSTQGSNNQTTQSNNQIKASKNNKNIIIGILVLSAIFVFLKIDEES
jgi:hypothetical protein